MKMTRPHTSFSERSVWGYNREVKKFPSHLLTSSEKKIFRRLSTPEKIQDFLNTFSPNKDDSLRSVHVSLGTKTLHCLEGAFLAAAALWHNGETPLLLDLRTHKKDADHVVALFKRNGLWGALSATHHAVLRYRDPIYKNLRELALSYFHEYFLPDGKKSLLAYSTKPFSLLTYGTEWINGDSDLYDIGADLDDAPHTLIAPLAILKKLRRADPLERLASDTTLPKQASPE